MKLKKKEEREKREKEIINEGRKLERKVAGLLSHCSYFEPDSFCAD